MRERYVRHAAAREFGHVRGDLLLALTEVKAALDGVNDRSRASTDRGVKLGTVVHHPNDRVIVAVNFYLDIL